MRSFELAPGSRRGDGRSRIRRCSTGLTRVMRRVIDTLVWRDRFGRVVVKSGLPSTSKQEVSSQYQPDSFLAAVDLRGTLSEP